MAGPMKYLFNVHVNVFHDDSGREYNYGYELETDNRYPTPSDIERWKEEVMSDLEEDEDANIQILSFSRMKKEKGKKNAS